MKSDTMKISERRRIRCAASVRTCFRSVAPGLGAIPRERVQYQQQLLAPAARRDDALNAPENIMAPARLPLPQQQPAHQGGEFRQHGMLGDTYALKITEGLMSSRNQAVISRSSRYSRT